MRPSYGEYVKAAMRYYSKIKLASVPQEPRFRSDADKKNWAACEAAIKDLSSKDKELVLRVYGYSDTLADNIYRISKDEHISQDHLWDLVNTVEKRFAKRRGLI